MVLHANISKLFQSLEILSMLARQCYDVSERVHHEPIDMIMPLAKDPFFYFLKDEGGNCFVQVIIVYPCLLMMFYLMGYLNQCCIYRFLAPNRMCLLLGKWMLPRKFDKDHGI